LKYLLGLLLSALAIASPTTVTGTLYMADGVTLFNGTIFITWGTFTGGDGKIVPAGSFATLISAGVLSVSLEDNATATPTGTSYTVRYALTGPNPATQKGTPMTEFWVVPNGGPVSLNSVRTNPPPVVAYSTLPASGIVGQVTVPQGGTGDSAFTAHAVLIGNGSANLTQAIPSTAAQCFMSNGASVDPSFQTCVASTTTTSFTAGSLLFAGAGVVAQNNARLFWDNANFRLGINNNSSLLYALDVGSGGIRFFDNTAVTGQTVLALRNGANQTAVPLIQFFLNNGTSGGQQISWDGTRFLAAFDVFQDPAQHVALNGTQGLEIGSGMSYLFSSDTTNFGTPDVRFHRSAANTMQIDNGSGGLAILGVTGDLYFSLPTHFASLGSPANGMVLYCDDCAANSNPCAGSGSGAIAKRLGNGWDCR
jgi:hypothetical protein